MICVNFAQFGLNGLDTVAGTNGDKFNVCQVGIGFKGGDYSEARK